MMDGVVMGTPGRRRRVELEDEYWRLLMSGVGTVEACREVGIGRITFDERRTDNISRLSIVISTFGTMRSRFFGVGPNSTS